MLALYYIDCITQYLYETRYMNVHITMYVCHYDGNALRGGWVFSIRGLKIGWWLSPFY